MCFQGRPGIPGQKGNVGPQGLKGESGQRGRQGFPGEKVSWCLYDQCMMWYVCRDVRVFVTFAVETQHLEC